MSDTARKKKKKKANQFYKLEKRIKKAINKKLDAFWRKNLMPSGGKTGVSFKEMQVYFSEENLGTVKYVRLEPYTDSDLDKIMETEKEKIT